MLNPLAWVLKRRRADRLRRGFSDAITGAPVYYWCDPATGDCWMATRRYSLFAVATDRSRADILGVRATWLSEEVTDG